MLIYPLKTYFVTVRLPGFDGVPTLISTSVLSGSPACVKVVYFVNDNLNPPVISQSDIVSISACVLPYFISS